jgi:transposase
MNKELEINAKRLSPKEQFQIRKTIIRNWKQGKTNPEIAEALGVSERHVRATKKSYQENGMAGISLQRRGRREGDKRRLTPDQEKEIKAIIIDKHPEQMKLKGCLWTRKNIHDLIERKYKINMPLSTLGYYLQRWGFSVQRPIKKAYKQNPEQIQKWLKEEYPAIRERAKTEKAEIYWGDETAIQNTANYAKGYAPKGKTPVLEVESIKMKLNMLSAVSNQGKLRFLLDSESIDSNKLIDFMSRLTKDTGHKVFFILDNLRVHHSKKVSKWLDQHKNEIEVFYLPPYAPEYNPDEYLNSDLKRHIGTQTMPHSNKDLERKTRSFMKIVQLRPAHVKSYFGAKPVLYAA